ncbi:MAG: hypothetical protein Fur0024_0190 [Patescibacteria group bacterium]
MQFQVLQNVDIEDKILGPLTPRMFLLALGFTGAAVFVYVAFLPTWDVMLMIGLIIMTGIAFVFSKPLDMKFEQFLMVWIAFQLKAKQRVWFKVKQEVIEIRDVPSKNLMEDLVDQKKAISKDEIFDLTEILDSGGRSKLSIKKSTDKILKTDFELDYANSYLRESSYRKSEVSDYISDMNQNIDPSLNYTQSFQNVFASTQIKTDKSVSFISKSQKEFLESVQTGVREFYDESPLAGFSDSSIIEQEAEEESQNSQGKIQNIEEDMTHENQEVRDENQDVNIEDVQLESLKNVFEKNLQDVLVQNENTENLQNQNPVNSNDYGIPRNDNDDIVQTQTPKVEIQKVLGAQKTAPIQNGVKVENSRVENIQKPSVQNQNVQKAQNSQIQNSPNSMSFSVSGKDNFNVDQKNSVNSNSATGSIIPGEEVDLSSLFK